MNINPFHEYWWFTHPSVGLYFLLEVRWICNALDPFLILLFQKHITAGFVKYNWTKKCGGTMYNLHRFMHFILIVTIPIRMHCLHHEWAYHSWRDAKFNIVIILISYHRCSGQTIIRSVMQHHVMQITNTYCTTTPPSRVCCTLTSLLTMISTFVSILCLESTIAHLKICLANFLDYEIPERLCWNKPYWFF